MTSAPVTAPIVSQGDRRRQAVSRVFHSTHSFSGEPTSSDYANAVRFVDTLARRGDVAYSEVPDNGSVGLGGLLRSAIDRADRTHRQEMLRLHDWDEAVFGGYICLTCTPKEPVGPFEDGVGFPCPPLREVGVTDVIAADLIRAHYAEQAEKIREAQQAATTELPQLDGFRDFDGITVGYVGDHGDMVALGWHANYREVLHAFDSLARTDAGINGVYDNPNRTPSQHDLTRAWAINTGTGTGQDQWCLTWGVETTSDTEGAFPVTLLVM